MAFIRGVENAADISVTPRAQYIRTLVLELERIHSHILWAGVACYSIGFDSAFHLGMLLREQVMDILEILTGNRVNYGVATFGGVRWDITPELAGSVRKMLRYYRREFNPFRDIVFEDPIAAARMKGVGVLSYEDAIRYCAVGPIARASGLRKDLRHSSPYEAYCDITVTPVVPQDYFDEAHGDVFDRFVVRTMEVYQSLDIIEKVLDGLPEGDIVSQPDINKVLASLKKAEGVGWGLLEAPRGDDTHIVTLKAEDENVYRWKVRAPTYANTVAFPIMFKDNELADAPLIINSVDPCISCMERMVTTDKAGNKNYVSLSELINKSREKTRRMRGEI
jgi:membrane-bound hydrogenase subunit alpha